MTTQCVGWSRDQKCPSFGHCILSIGKYYSAEEPDCRYCLDGGLYDFMPCRCFHGRIRVSAMGYGAHVEVPFIDADGTLTTFTHGFPCCREKP